jgi:hypothetical protein
MSRVSPASHDARFYSSITTTWKVEPYSKTGKPALKITCPKCDSVAIVARQWRTSMSTTNVRCCTYCWGLSHMPNVAPKTKRARRTRK